MRDRFKDCLPDLYGQDDGAEGGKLVHSVACMYTMTPDEHFLIDFHPHYPDKVSALFDQSNNFLERVVLDAVFKKKLIDTSITVIMIMIIPGDLCVPVLRTRLQVLQRHRRDGQRHGGGRARRWRPRLGLESLQDSGQGEGLEGASRLIMCWV